MNYKIGDVLRVENIEYVVLGSITYRNPADNTTWDEYRIHPLTKGSDRWLSIDFTYGEFSISKMNQHPNRMGFHEVDRGVQIVAHCAGNVDVSVGDSAHFVEYEDSTEEKIISEEIWSDGMEVSEGYYLDSDEFEYIRSEPRLAGFSSAFSGNVTGSLGGKLLTVGVIAVFMLFVFLSEFIGLIGSNPSTIAKHLEKSSLYTYVTSVTGNEKQTAKVYSPPASYTIDTTAKEIIDAIEGKTQYVQQNSEEDDDAIAILTSKEYCLIYESLDGDVLVQVSNRKYVYTTDNEPYHSTHRTRHYYRNFYHTTGYSSDSSKYKKYSSPYSSYDSSSFHYTGDSYSSYSSSVRQSSVSSRQSSGGGLSGGK